MLGLATTRELLAEVASRMEITQNSINGRDLGRLARGAIDNLAPSVLDYRTVGPHTMEAAMDQMAYAIPNRHVQSTAGPEYYVGGVKDATRENHAVLEELDRLDRDTAMLGKVVSQLVERLELVLRPEEDSPNAGSVNPARPRCNLASRLAGRLDDVEHFTTLLVRLRLAVDV